MKKKSAKKSKNSLAAAKPENRPAAVSPAEESAQSSQESELAETVVTKTQAGKEPTGATTAMEPPHLLTPLAVLWPMDTAPEAPKALEKAPEKERAPAKAMNQDIGVTIVLLEPDAKQVSLCGDFNGWDPNATPMRRDEGGHWETTVALSPGRHEYKFVVDGEWIPDPLARENIWNAHGTLNSVIQIQS